MNAVEILERCRKGPEDIQEIAGKIERYRESATSITHFTDGIGGGRAKVVLNNKVRYADKRFLFPSDIRGNLL